MNYSSLLLNPNKIEFYLDEKEISLLNDAKRNLFKKYYSKTLSLIWEVILNNIKRRVEAFGSYEFIKSLDENERIRYFKKDDTTSKKIELLNSLVLIKNAFRQNIIDKKTFSIIDFFYNFCKTCDTNTLKKEELNSILTLLEINLFKIPIEQKAKQQIKKTVLLNEFINFETQKEDYSRIKKEQKEFNTKDDDSKKLKKEDILMMHYSNSEEEFYPLLTPIQTPQRRKEDRLHTLFQNDVDDNKKREFFYRRRKSDY